MARRDGDPLAVVMGDVDMVRALGVAGISSAFFGFADDSARFSRHVRVSSSCQLIRMRIGMRIRPPAPKAAH